jgi:Salmonella virulence plasmid 65kDa B protein
MTNQHLALPSAFRKLVALVLVILFTILPTSAVLAQSQDRPSSTDSVPIRVSDSTIQKNASASPPKEDRSTPSNEPPANSIKLEADSNRKDASVDLPSDQEAQKISPATALDPDAQNPIPQTVSASTISSRLPTADQASGALTYTYSFEVPPGRNGMEPDLRLTYNSQENNEASLFGYGWNINIPYIVRSNKTGAQNLYSSNTFLSSDAGELVDLGSGQYAAKVETGSFISFAFQNNVWTAKDKQGTTYTYGQSPLSRQDDPDNASRIYKWMLSEVRDTNGFVA